MRKAVAIVNVIAWSGFWAFGYIALTSRDLSERQVVIAAILAFAGFLTGMLAYIKLCRASEDCGLENKKTLDAATRERAQSQGGL